MLAKRTGSNYRVRSATRRAAGDKTSVCGEPGAFAEVEKSKSGMTREVN